MDRKISLGKIISMRRKYLHLTQEDFAEEIGVSKSAIAKWETDGGIPDRDNLKKLSEVISVSVDELYRIISRTDTDDADSKINITPEVIAALESYGYRVIRPNNEERQTKD